MPDLFRIQLATDLIERDAVVAEIWFGDQLWAEVWYSGETLRASFYQPANGKYFEMDYEVAQRALSMAADRLGAQLRPEDANAETVD